MKTTNIRKTNQTVKKMLIKSLLAIVFIAALTGCDEETSYFIGDELFRPNMDKNIYSSKTQAERFLDRMSVDNSQSRKPHNGTPVPILYIVSK